MEADYRNISSQQIEEFIPYLRGHIRTQYPGFRESDELYAAGLEGVAEGIRRYDGAKGTAYTYWVQHYAACYVRNRYGELTGSPKWERSELDVDEIPGDTPDPFDEEASRQQTAAALSALDGDEARVIDALYWQGLSLRSAAKQLGMKTDAVFRTHRRALAKMRRALGVSE